MSTAWSGPQESGDWKQQVAERLDAYRAHHPRAAKMPEPAHRSRTESRAAKIAEAVRSRYAAAPTYSEVLTRAQAEEAARTIPEPVEVPAQVECEAEAESNPETISQGWQSSPPDDLQPSPNFSQDLPAAEVVDDEEVFVSQHGSTIPRGTPVMPAFAARTQEMHLHQPEKEAEPSLEEFLASTVVEARAALPSKLIEFPRELISPHRARPRLPVIPHETVPPVDPWESTQLTIFEVAAEPVVAAPATVELQASENVTAEVAPELGEEDLEAAAPMVEGESRSSASKPEAEVEREADRSVKDSASHTSGFRKLEWAAISLDKEPALGRARVSSPVAEYVPFLVDPASIDRRVMAGAVDFALVSAGFLTFLVVFVASTPHLPHGLGAAVMAGAAYLGLWVLYQMLFFSLSGATAGMLYARIALCTFDDQNPTRPAMRRRLAAWWLSCLPLGMGFLWAFVDEDNLCWHDRMTRSYQREY